LKVGLFIPCYIDQFYPEVGISSLELLEQLEINVEYPLEQSCCGQPLVNSGYEREASKLHENYFKQFKDFDYVVMPSGSCALHVKEHMPELQNSEEGIKLATNTYEIVEFIHDVLGNPKLNISFPHKIILHIGCHSIRGLNLSSCSEKNETSFSKVEKILEQVKGLEIVTPDYADECCGFGGTFSVFEKETSVKMGIDKLNNFKKTGAKIVVTTDISCTMHLEGIAKHNKMDFKFIHISQLLMNNVPF